MEAVNERVTHDRNRRPGPEVLRCIAMMMVLVLHYMWNGGFLQRCEPGMSGTTCLSWILESFAICAVDIYVLLSGFFLYDSYFRVKRLLRLLVQVWVFSVGIGLLGVLTGLCPDKDVTEELFLTLFFPVLGNHYWFVTEYVKFYLMIPIVGLAVRRLPEAVVKVIAVLYFIPFCLIKSFLANRMAGDRKGYDCIWFLFVFLIAVFIRKNKDKYGKKRGYPA